MGGFGSSVLEALAAAEQRVPVRVLAAPDRIIEHGNPNTLITSTGLPILAKLRSLKELDISGTRISGGLEPLIQLDQLEVLIADDLELSDADVEAISQIPKLKLLYVTESGISEEGRQKLRDTVRQVKFGGETTLELAR